MHALQGRTQSSQDGFGERSSVSSRSGGMTAPIGWDDPRTAAAYEQFCRRHPRYRVANDALIAHASLCAGQRVLDVAAGTGRTAQAALPLLGESGFVLCVEPARA